MKQNRIRFWILTGISAILIISVVHLWLWHTCKPSKNIPAKDIYCYIPEMDSLILFELNNDETTQILNFNKTIRSWLEHTNSETDIIFRISKKIQKENPSEKLLLGIYRPGTINTRLILWSNTNPKQNKKLKKWLDKNISSAFRPEKESDDSLLLWHYTIPGNQFISCLDGNGIFGISNDYKLIRESIATAYNKKRFQNKKIWQTRSKEISQPSYICLTPELLPGGYYLKPNNRKISLECAFYENKIWNTGFIPYQTDNNLIQRLQYQPKSLTFNADAFSEQTILGMQYQIPDIQAFLLNPSTISDSILTREIDNEINIAWIKNNNKKNLDKIISIRIKHPNSHLFDLLSTRLEAFPAPLCNDTIYQNCISGNYLYLFENNDLIQDYIQDIQSGNTISHKNKFMNLNEQISERINWIFFGIDIPKNLTLPGLELYRQCDFFTELSTGHPNAIFCNSFVISQ
ncbi:hypothetical protein [Coprobacter sp.]